MNKNLLTKKIKGDIVEEVDSTDHIALNDIVEKEEVTEHGDKAEQTEASHDVDHRIL